MELKLIDNNEELVKTIANEIYETIINEGINEELINRLNGFFKGANRLIKGDASLLIVNETTESPRYITTNLYNDSIDIIECDVFALNVKDYMMANIDNIELSIDLIKIANKYGLFKVTESIRLYLFKKIYESGFMSYVALDNTDFRANFDYLFFDLRIISDVISTGELDAIEQDFNESLNYWYPIEEQGETREYYTLYDVIG